MSDWFIIIPEETTNLVTNPSAEENITGYTVGAGALAQSAATAKFGVYSIEWTPAAAPFDFYYWPLTLAATTTYTFSIWFQGQAGIPYRIFAYDSVAPVILGTPTTFVGTGTWQRHEVTFTTGANTAIWLYLSKGNSADVGVVYADAWQCEQLAYSTTYADGDQPGCEWTGFDHNSTSRRASLSRGGGRIRDLQAFYGFNISSMIDIGMPPHTLNVDSYAVLPGGQLNSTKVEWRSFVLIGFFQSITNDPNGVHDRRRLLINILGLYTVPNNQPVILRYTGADVDKEILAYYDDGLGLNMDARMPCWEDRIALRFVSPDPFWYEVGESGGLLDPQDTDTFRYCAGRLRSTGQWDDLGLAADPNTNGTVYDIAIGPDRKVYFGGDFLGWNAQGGWDYIVRYDPEAGVWERVGGAGDFNNIIYALEFLPDGTLIAGGAFTAPNPADYVAQYDIPTNTWAVLAAGGTGTVLALHYSPYTGNLYLGGTFIAWNADLSSDYFVSYSLIAGTYSNVGNPDQGTAAIVDCTAITTDRNRNIYVGGNFLNWGGVAAADYIAIYTAPNWLGVSTGMNGDVEGLVIDRRGLLYAAGSFTTAGGVTVAGVAVWDGAVWAAVGTRIANLQDIVIADDGLIYVSGSSGSNGRWNGSAWFELDISFGAATFYAVMTAERDPVIARNYDVYLGYSITGVELYNGLVTANNQGNVDAFPRIAIENVDGTGRGINLYQIRNETTGREIVFDPTLGIRDGERITINLTPTIKSVMSSLRGEIFELVLPSSDLATFALQPGNNDVSLYVTAVGAVLPEAFIVWRDPYWSVD